MKRLTLIVFLIAGARASAAGVDAKLPWTIRNVCRVYLETLNPWPPLVETYRLGELDWLIRPIETFVRSDREYMARRESEWNQMVMKWEAELADRAAREGAMPVHPNHELHLAMARAQGREYHVVINSFRRLYVRDEEQMKFSRGWALLLDPRTKMVEWMEGPRGEARPWE